MKTPGLISLMLFLIVSTGNSSQADTAAAKTAPNARGSIDIAQAQTHAERMFSHVDADANGEISPQEFESMAHRRGGKWQGKPPAGHPGMARAWMRSMQDPEDLAERADAFRDEIFQNLDRDADGLLSQQEFSQVRETTQRVVRHHMFERLDSNSDGRLTPDEFPGFIKRLKQFDQDGDGIVTRSEMRAGLIASWSAGESPDASKDDDG